MSSAPYVQVRTGNCHIAIAVEHVVQAVDMPAAGLARLPRRGGALAGVLESAFGAVPVVALDRWVALGTLGDPALARVLVMRTGASLIGIQVDAVMGVQRIDADTVRRIHHDDGDEELFQAIVPATGQRPLLCLLEVERLCRLGHIWCQEADVPQPPACGTTAASSDTRRQRLRHAVLDIRGDLWAVPAAAIARVSRTPAPELQWPGRRTCGIGSFEGRKLALVDLGAGGGAGAGLTAAAGSGPPGAIQARPWMAVVDHGSQSIGLLATACGQFADLSPENITADTDNPLRSGTAFVQGLGKLGILDIGKLFDSVPEAAISEAGAVGDTPPVGRRGAAPGFERGGTAGARSGAGGRGGGQAGPTGRARAGGGDGDGEPAEVSGDGAAGRTDANANANARAGAGAGAGAGAAPTHYIVFEADHRYVGYER